MPLFDMVCDGCGLPEKDVLLRRPEDAYQCPKCGCAMRKIVSPVAAIGIVWSNARTLPGGVGEVRSNAELRRGESQLAERGFVPVSATDRRVRDKGDRAFEAANKMAQAQGYAGHYQRSEAIRKERGLPPLDKSKITR